MVGATKLRSWRTAVLSAGIVAATARGATIFQDTTQGGTTNWAAAVSWTDDLAPSAGNDYVSGAPFDIRTPTSATPAAFQGKSLTIQSGARIIAKHNYGTTAVIADLRLDGGQLYAGNATAGTTAMIMSGNLAILSASSINLTDTTNRSIAYTGGALTGAGALTVNGTDTNDVFTLDGMNATAHTGAMAVATASLYLKGGNSIGDTSPVTLTASQLKIGGNETFGALTGNSASSLTNAAAGYNLTLQPQASATYAGSIQAGFDSLTIKGQAAATQTLSGTSASVGTVAVGGGTLALANTNLTTSSYIYVGSGGTGAISQTGSSVVTAGANGIRIGNGAADVGTYTMNAPTGSLNSTGYLYIGYNGNGTLTHTSGTTTVLQLRIGETSGSSAVVNFDGGTLNADQMPAGRNGGASTSFFMNGGTLNIAGNGWATYNGTGTFTQTGGSANFNEFRLTQPGAPGGAAGTLNLNGGTLTTNALTKGGGTAAVNMNGGTLRAGSSFTSTLPIAINGAGGGIFDSNGNTLTLSGALSGTGPITKIGAGTLAIANANVGSLTVKGGTVSVNDGTLTTSGLLYVGSGGTGAMSQTGSSVVTAGGIIRIGSGAADVGTYTMNAPTGSLNSSGYLYVGYNGNGTLTHTSGTTTVLQLRIGETPGSTAVVNFDGGTLNADQMPAGRNGNANTNFYMNGGTLNIAGVGWATYNGSGTFTQTGGSANFNEFRVTNSGAPGGAVGTLNMNGGTMTTKALTKGGGTATVNMDGGTLRAGSSFASSVPIAINGTGGGTFDSNGNTLTLSGALSGAGPITKIGAGTVVLSGANNGTGPIDVAAGMLKVSALGAVGNSSQVHIGTGATFDVTAISGGGGYSPAGINFSGKGLLDAGAGTINMAGGSFSPGNSPGALAVGGNLNGLGTYSWQLYDAGSSAGTGWDLINVSGIYTILGGDAISIAGLSSIGPDVSGVPLNFAVDVKGAQSGPFTILDAAGGIVGLASSISINPGNLAGYGYFTLTIVGTQLQLTFISTVPEPGTWAIMGLLLVVCGFAIQRRRQSALA